MLYNDPFFGQFDTNVIGNEKAFYENAIKVLSKAEKNSNSYKYIFKFEKELCRVLSLKYQLGAKTRKAYQEEDFVELRKIVDEYVQTIKYVKKFLLSFETLWEIENKPNGFEVQHIRIGGLIQRLTYCKNKILRYLNAEIDSIPELEINLIDAHGLKNKDEVGFIDFNLWHLNSSVNNI